MNRLAAWFVRLPLRRQLTCAILVVCGTTLLLATLAIAAFEVASHRRSLREAATLLADVLGKASEAAVAFADREEADRTLAAIAIDGSILEAALHDARGGLLSHFLRSGETPRIVPDDGPARFANGSLWVTRPILRDGTRLGSLSLRVDLSGMYTRIGLLVAVEAAVLVGALLAAMAMARAMQRPISAPIVELAATAREIAARGDYTVRASRPAGQEIADLTDAFNRMLDRILEQKQRLEEQAAELRRSNAELEQFTYVSSHDLKEPLRMVTMYLDLLRMRHGAALPAQAHGYLATATAGAARMQALIDDILAYARLDHAHAQSRPIDLGEAMAEAQEHLRAEIARTGARIEVGAMPVVRGERSQLVQLFQNLLSNALKYRRGVPHITVTARRDADEWVVTVADDGIGIAPEHAARIFGMFQRLHSRDEYQGTGIGLTICRRIAERHGGRIWVDSQPGQGARFSVALPVPRRPADGDSAHDVVAMGSDA